MKKTIIPILFLFLNSFSFAFKLTPMSIAIEGGGKQNIANFTVSNDSDSPIAVQLEVKVRDMLPDGSEKLPETEDFLIFPDQLVLGPKKRRVVKVRWLKGEVKGIEKSFRLIAEQLPVDLKKKKESKTDIKILLRYVAALYVAPTDGKAKVKVASAVTSKNLKHIDLTLENIGSIHKILARPEITILQQSKSFKVTNYEGILGENILAGAKRSFRLIAPKGVNVQKPYQVQYSNAK
jgi:fimbrial chaperone protein